MAAQQTYSPEQLECAARGGTWDRVNGQCTQATALGPSLPLAPVLGASVLGTVDPQQMFDDGFVYVNFQWVKADSPEAIAHIASTSPAAAGGGGVRPGSLSVLSVITPGSVLGYPVPSAPAVLLPSFVGGRLGEIREPGGMRPVSGGGPDRVQMGPADMPVVRMLNEWGR